MIIVYTGNGKGKTSSAFGVALRARGYNKKVHIIQFGKTKNTGEYKAAKKLGIDIKTFGRKEWIDCNNPKQEHIRLAQEAVKYAVEVINKKPFLVILDEINIALHCKLISKQEVLNLIKLANNKHVHLILTGRYAKPYVKREADLVTEMKEVKHPFRKGIPAVRGLDW